MIYKNKQVLFAKFHSVYRTHDPWFIYTQHRPTSSAASFVIVATSVYVAADPTELRKTCPNQSCDVIITCRSFTYLRLFSSYNEA